jgi:hypothetical protein
MTSKKVRSRLSDHRADGEHNTASPLGNFKGQRVFKVFGVFDWEANPGYLVAFYAEGTNQGSVTNLVRPYYRGLIC